MADHTRDPSVAPPTGTPTGWDSDAGRWEHDTLRRATRHGVRLFNDGAYHEAHDCFELEWYNYGRGTTESAFLHGMVQVAAGAHKRVDLHDDGGLRSLLETARQYLQGVPHDFYGVDVREIRTVATNAIDTPATIDAFRIRLDDERPVADETDYAYLEAREP